MTTISIIGTAGRDRQRPATKEKFVAMVHDAKDLLDTLGTPETIQLVSGGAAFADHIAVSLHLMYGYPLTLHLPAQWNHQLREFDYDSRSRAHSPGRVANYWHRQFASSWDNKNRSLHTLHRLISQELIKVHVYNGFLTRNLAVAKSDIVIAYTWGITKPPKGGTQHTWNHATGTRIHRSLHEI